MKYNVHKRFFVSYFATINPKINITTSLSSIAAKAALLTAENDEFQAFLRSKTNEIVDNAVQLLDADITPQIDCRSCGNCCKSLMIVVEEKEADDLADFLQQSRADFDDQYVEKGSNGMMLMNAIPCSFLNNNSCSVYEHRFAGCREFPALHLPQIKDRLFTVFMHYERCPIIFNVMEQLKIDLNFHQHPTESSQ